MINNRNTSVLLKNIYPLEEDLIFFYGDLRVYSRKEIFRVIINKFQVLKDRKLIGVYLESLIGYQGEKYSLISKEKPAESLILFFDDLRKAVLKIPPDELQRSDNWVVDFSELLYALKNSAYFFAHGTYLEDDEHFPKSDALVKHYINILSGDDEQKKIKKRKSDHPKEQQIDKYLTIAEAMGILGCSRSGVYRHIRKGLKTVFPLGPESYQKIERSELIRYMQTIRQN